LLLVKEHVTVGQLLHKSDRLILQRRLYRPTADSTIVAPRTKTMLSSTVVRPHKPAGGVAVHQADEPVRDRRSEKVAFSHREHGDAESGKQVDHAGRRGPA